MPIQVLEARYRGDHRVWLRFDDGLAGETDLSGELDGEVFEPLRDPAYFARFRVDETLLWPHGVATRLARRGGADFAPEFLHERVARSG